MFLNDKNDLIREHFIYLLSLVLHLLARLTHNIRCWLNQSCSGLFNCVTLKSSNFQCCCEVVCSLVSLLSDWMTEQGVDSSDKWSGVWKLIALPRCRKLWQVKRRPATHCVVQVPQAVTSEAVSGNSLHCPGAASCDKWSCVRQLIALSRCQRLSVRCCWAAWLQVCCGESGSWQHCCHWHDCLPLAHLSVALLHTVYTQGLGLHKYPADVTNDSLIKWNPWYWINICIIEGNKWIFLLLIYRDPGLKCRRPCNGTLVCVCVCVCLSVTLRLLLHSSPARVIRTSKPLYHVGCVYVRVCVCVSHYSRYCIVVN